MRLLYDFFEAVNSLALVLHIVFIPIDSQELEHHDLLVYRSSIFVIAPINNESIKHVRENAILKLDGVFS